MPSHRFASFQGGRRPANHDAAGHAASGPYHLYVVVDGTYQADSGMLAKNFVDQLTQQFERHDWLHDDEAPSVRLLALLAEVRASVCSSYPLAAASYLILLIAPSLRGVIVHEGDCCLGVVDNQQQITWITPPHCVANWRGTATFTELADHPARHNLTRCLSARRIANPAISESTFATGTRLLMCTDGFWAEQTPNQQSAWLNGSHEEDTHGGDDDMTWFDIRM